MATQENIKRVLLLIDLLDSGMDFSVTELAKLTGFYRPVIYDFKETFGAKETDQPFLGFKPKHQKLFRYDKVKDLERQKNLSKAIEKKLQLIDNVDLAEIKKLKKTPEGHNILEQREHISELRKRQAKELLEFQRKQDSELYQHIVASTLNIVLTSD